MTINATMQDRAEKEALESHSQKQGKASISGLAAASQNKTNTSPVASSAKTSLKSSPSLHLLFPRNNPILYR